MNLSRRLFQAGIVLAAILLPLEIVPNHIISVGSYLTTLLLAQYAIFGGSAMRTTLRAQPRRTLGIIFIALVLPVIAAVVSIAVSDHSDVAMRASITLAHLALRAALIALLATRVDIRLFERAVIAVAAIAVGFGFFQYFGDLAGLPSTITRLIDHYSSHGTYGFPRVHSTAHEPLYFDNFLFLPIGLLLVRVWQGANRNANILLAASLTLFWTTVARGAAAGLIVMLLLMAVVGWRRSDSLKRLTIPVATSIVGAILMVGLSALVTGQNNLNSFGHHAVETGDKSFTNRTVTWPLAGTALKEHPLLGVGIGNSREYLDDHGPRSQATYTALPVFNNSYLTFATEEGLLGILCLIPLVTVLLLAIAWMLRSTFEDPITAYALALIGIAIQANTFEAFTLLRLWIVVGVVLAVYRLGTTKPTPA